MQFSFIIPTFNEAAELPQLVSELQRIHALGHEVIIVDGGSQDMTVEVLVREGYHVIGNPPGRAKQMNSGACEAKNDVLVFLHADTRLPVDAFSKMMQACQHNSWGRFDVAFTETGFLFKVIAAMMNFRSRITGVATGDQCIFVRKNIFEQVGRFPDISLMEDVALSKKLKKIASPACLDVCVITSARRWKQKGILRTIILMWYLRLAYFLGVAPNKLHQLYYDK